MALDGNYTNHQTHLSLDLLKLLETKSTLVVIWILDFGKKINMAF